MSDSHDYHRSLPGFDPRQIFVDGCKVCERRGADLPVGITLLDGDHFRKAWQRAVDWQSSGSVGLVSEAETPALRMLYAVAVMLERHCALPLGELPFCDVSRLAESLNRFADRDTL